MSSMSRFRKKVDTWLGYVLVVLMAAMVLDVVWGVMSRLVLNNPSSFTDELAGYLLIWVGLLGASLASGRGMHLSINLLPNKLGPPARRKLNITIQIIIFLFALGILIIGGIRLVYITLSLGQMSPSLDIPVGYVYLVLPLSGICIIFYCIADIYENIVAAPENNEQTLDL